MKQKMEYFIEIAKGNGNGDGTRRKVRAHYFLVSSNGDLIFFIVSKKFGDKTAIQAFAAGTWIAVRENWSGGTPSESKNDLSHVNFLKEDYR